MVTTTAQIRDLLLPGLNQIMAEYDMFPMQWGDVFDKSDSEMFREIDVEMKILGLAQLRNEGQATPFEDMGERYQYVYMHQGVALGFIMTKFAIRDNLYKTQFGPNATYLRDSFMQTKEIYGASVLNFSNDSSRLGGDGQPLGSLSHPIDTGVYANTPAVQVELNESSLFDGTVAIRRFRNAAGLRVNLQAQKLIVPPELANQAERLLKSELRPATANNDINATRSRNLLPAGYAINDFLTNTKSWFVKSNLKNGLRYFQRDPFEPDMYVDPDTDNLKVRATERYSFGWSNPRAIYCAQPV